MASESRNKGIRETERESREGSGSPDDLREPCVRTGKKPRQPPGPMTDTVIGVGLLLSVPDRQITVYTHGNRKIRRPKAW